MEDAMTARPLPIIVAAPLFAALAATSALAAQARASGNVPVYDGPDNDYEVIDHLVDGEYYDVLDCWYRARWCLVGEDGEELGWVRGSNLVGAAAKLRVTPFEFLSNPRTLFDPHP
jgi:uncharacterized protein YraI